MRCPNCGSDETAVRSTRAKDRPGAVSGPRTIVSCDDCGEVW